MQVERITIDNVRISAFDRSSLLDAYVDALEGSQDRLFVGFYAALLRKAAIDKHYADDLAAADYIYADGAGVVLALRLLARAASVERLATTDIWPDLVKLAADRGEKVAIIASTDSSLQPFKARIEAMGADVALSLPGYLRTDGEAEVIAATRASGASLVLIGMGAGAQEDLARKLIEARGGENRQVIFTIGGLADHVAHVTKRAPMWVQSLGMEWAWRVAQEPRRLLSRYLKGNGYFLVRLFKRILWSR